MGKIIDVKNLPEKFPTHKHPSEFWEQLGRTVATFGFLEEMLKKAIQAFEGSVLAPVADREKAVLEFSNTIKKAAKDPLGSLIKLYQSAAYKHYLRPDDKKFIDDIVSALKKAKGHRDALCHASWSSSISNGACKPFFINRNLEQCDTPIDKDFLPNTQKHTAELACEVISSVTRIGIEFPGHSLT